MQNPKVGACSMHARATGGGLGIFFLVQRCVVLVVRDKHAAFLPSLYLDQYGEEDVGLRRGRPLFLSGERYAELQEMYRSHRLAGEVARIRSSADRVLRENHY